MSHRVEARSNLPYDTQLSGGHVSGRLRLVRQWLREHNWKTNPGFMERLQQPEHEARPLVLLAVEDGDTVGGLFAETQLSWLQISIMASAPTGARKGLGRRWPGRSLIGIRLGMPSCIW